MTLLQVINTIQKISSVQPNIHSFVGEFLDLNDVTAKYSAIILQQRTHRRNNDFITYSFYLGYADRLNEDKSNEVEVQSTAIQVIDDIVYKLENLNLDCTVGVYNTFTQRFLAEAAGGYVELDIVVPMGECEDDFAKEELNATITANGVYSWIPKGLGFENVKINVDVAHLQDKSLNITKNGNYKVQYDKGFSGLGTVDLAVTVPTAEIHNQEKNITITQNGQTEIVPDTDYTGLSKVSVNTAIDTDEYYNEGYDKGKEDGISLGIQQQKDKLTDISITENGNYERQDGYKKIEVNVPTVNNQEKSITITENGQTDIVPDTDYTGLSKIGINVNINTQSYYDNGYSQGKIDGKEDGIAEQKAKLTDLNITENGTYTKEDGYKSVVADIHPKDKLERTYIENGQYLIDGEYKGGEITVNVDTQSSYNQGYADGETKGKEDGITEQKAKLTDITITTNGTYSREDGYKSVVVNVSSSVGGNSQWTGSVDTNGLKSLNWTDDDISNFQGNVWWYSWNDKKYMVSNEIEKYPILTDTSSVTDFSSKFCYKRNFIAIPKFDTSKGTVFGGFGGEGTSASYGMLEGCCNLKYVPDLDTSNGTEFERMFYGCNSIETLPTIDTSKGRLFTSMFENCSSLKTVPLFNLSSGTSFNMMFQNCTSLTDVPKFDTSYDYGLAGVNFSSMFNGCVSLKSIPKFNLIHGDSFANMFKNCYSLTDVPEFNTYGKHASDFSSMYEGCESLTSLGGIRLDYALYTDYMFKNCTKLNSIGRIYGMRSGDYNNYPTSTCKGMFWGCTSIKIIPEMDTRIMHNFDNMFYDCKNMTTIELINITNANSVRGMFENCWLLTDITFTGSINKSISFDYSTKLSYNSIKSILTACSDTTNTKAKAVGFDRTIQDQNQELTNLVASCTEKGWQITGLTITQ